MTVRIPADRKLCKGVGIANGSFGELLQGVLPGNQNHFLVTLPIDCYSRAWFIPVADSHEILVFPSHKVKSLRLAEAIMAHFQLSIGGRLYIESDLVEGKGLASSSADLVATARAIAYSLNEIMSPEIVMGFLKEIEPTDGIMFPMNVFFYHRKVEYGRTLGCLPEMKIVALDEGGIVDTLDYNSRLPPVLTRVQHIYNRYLQDMIQAFERPDLAAIGAISTQSALLNQELNPKKYLHQVIAICNEVGGLGVVITHSGPCIGVLLAKGDVDYEQKLEITHSKMSSLTSKVLLIDTIAARDHREPLHSHLARWQPSANLLEVFRA